LRGIAERVQQIGGHLLLESVPTQGTKLQVEVNIQQKEAISQVLYRLRPEQVNSESFTV
jgi:signal transduction histidine kinase